MQEFLIRPATPNDLTELCGMIAQLALHHGDVASVDPDFVTRELLGPRACATTLIAHRAREIGGYLVMLPLLHAQFSVRGADVNHLFVKEAFRSNGVGALLMDAAVKQAQRDGCRFLAVGTHPENAKAAAFYEHLGYNRRPAPGPRFSLKLNEA